uniref:Uncharacterized protein n=2 Tax=Clytia hemisphaerica TaxID=252671 RepID=A0A7M5XA74_9CNID
RFIHTTNLEIAASITQAILEQGKFTDEREIKACCRRYYETKKKEEKKLLMDDDEREKMEKYQRRYSRRDRLYKSRNKQVNALKEQIGPDVFHLWTTTACPELMSDEESDVDNEEVLVRRSPTWRDPTLTNLICNLPIKRGGTKKQRILGQPSTRSPPGHKS